MSRRNRVCESCGAKYSYCPDCGGADKYKPAWHAAFCSESCMEIWDIATKYNMNLLSKQEAKELMSCLDMKEKSQYVECLQKDITAIFAVEKAQPAKKQAQTHEVVTK